MVLMCTTSALYAQTPGYFFQTFPGDVTWQFKFILDRGESMQVELMHIDDLQHLPNLDSVVAIVTGDIPQLVDTSEQVLHGRRLAYIGVDSGRQVMLRAGTDRNEYFLSRDGRMELLKMDEDTVTVTGVIKTGGPTRFYRLSFFLNDFNNLKLYNNGQLQEKIRLLMQQKNGKWLRAEDGSFHLKDNPGITAPTPAGKAGGTGLLLLRPSIDIQNYRDRFVPSITVGLAITKRRNFIYKEYGVSSEAHFRFAKINDKDKIFVQSFLTLSYGRGKTTSNMTSPVRLFPFISVSYLTRSKGDLYENNTFRLGVGRFFLGNNSTKLEPAIYMNDVFKNITPSLRVVQVF